MYWKIRLSLWLSVCILAVFFRREEPCALLYYPMFSVRLYSTHIYTVRSTKRNRVTPPHISAAIKPTTPLTDNSYISPTHSGTVSRTIGSLFGHRQWQFASRSTLDVVRDSVNGASRQEGTAVSFVLWGDLWSLLFINSYWGYQM